MFTSALAFCQVPRAILTHDLGLMHSGMALWLQTAVYLLSTSRAPNTTLCTLHPLPVYGTCVSFLGQADTTIDER